MRVVQIKNQPSVTASRLLDARQPDDTKRTGVVMVKPKLRKRDSLVQILKAVSLHLIIRLYTFLL
jgi:hypothetical protein